MKVSEAFPSKYLKADDLNGRNVSVLISHIDFEPMTDGENKPVIYFQNKTKGLVCNKTNANILALIYGDEMDGWTGKEVVLTTEIKTFQGRAVKGLSVRVPTKTGSFRRFNDPPHSENPADFGEDSIEDTF